MFMKHRTESRELIILRSLHVRMELSSKEKQYYINLEKGYEGEKKFDELLMKLPIEWVILNDLLFEMNNSEFQIDSLLFSRNTFHLFEIKNYCGDFYIDGNKWYSTSGTEIKNPLNQLQRSESLLNNLLKELRIHAPIVPHLVFINPEFTLYQAPLNTCIIFPTQIDRLMKH
ncbi:NERD domain-containing protein [Bacillus sp. Bva_UNVM-123]|uniref:nuclease-related domain-containing protein n=1 Tax=Bacillus sp. Bva_UNVM-123 TaxID=2829798 RepID=UPI00391F4785